MRFTLAPRSLHAGPRALGQDAAFELGVRDDDVVWSHCPW